MTLSVLDSDNSYNSNLFFEKVMDERQMPTIFLNSEIEQAIKNKDESNLFLLILVSLFLILISHEIVKITIISCS